MKLVTWKNFIIAASLAALFLTGVLVGATQVEKPKSVIHVVTVKWKDTATDAQKKAALDGVEQLAKDYPGIKRVWLRSIKSQTMDAACVMEFESEQSLKDYADSPAQKKWYEVYIPVRERSVTSDITN
jgi:antibiotic biosynthesis monooxygenase (ABM) superfamily enzyme